MHAGPDTEVYPTLLTTLPVCLAAALDTFSVHLVHVVVSETTATCMHTIL